MKIHRILLLFIILSSFTACSLSKMNKTYRKNINGSWTLTNVEYKNNTGMFKSVLFNDTQAVCFEGSSWFFRNNNSTGSYTINKPGNCVNGTRNIRWSVYEPDSGGYQLQFKFIDEKKKDLSPYGYRLAILQSDAETMVLESKNSVEGEPISLIYTFKRTSF
ncbi:MAG: lipocalin family protein [Bacteroidota bacterium]